PLPALARRSARAHALRPRADRPRRLVSRLGGGPRAGPGAGARGVRLLQQPLGRALPGERQPAEAPGGGRGRRGAGALAAGRAVLVARGPEAALPAGPPPAESPGRSRAAVAFIFVTVMLDVLAIGLVIPVLPRLVQAFMGGDPARGARMFGVFGTTCALMRYLGSPLL